MDTEQWLNLIHSSASCPNRWHRRLPPWTAPSDLSPDEVSAFLRKLMRVGGPPDHGAVRAGLRWLNASDDHRLLAFIDPGYPRRLLEIPDPPLALFVKGDPACLARPCVAIVGSRSATPQGRETAHRLARQLALTGMTVVSGLAHGIDGSAHRGALQAGATVGVCGHGLNTVYPAAHRRLASAISGTGALLSEFPPGVPPRRSHFPQRNRLISGLSLGTLVVEAGTKSGSLISARLAAEQNREVFAVPGSIDSPQSKGCHELIRNGATLVETLEDILRELPPFDGGPRDGMDGMREGSGASAEHAWFLDYMGYGPCTRDALVNRSGLTPAEVSSMLSVLELEGCVEKCPGGTYVRLTRS